MKKFYLTILFLALSFIGFAQQRGNLFVVPHWTTNFTMSLPAQSLVQCTDSGKIYRLLVIGQPTKNLSNTANVVYPTSVGHADSSNVSGFAWLVDSMHIYYYWNVDSLLFDNAYGGNIHCDSIWATTHYAVSAFDTVQKVRKITTDTLKFSQKLAGMSDTLLILEDDIVKYKIGNGNGNGNFWSLTGNAGTDTSTNFIGTTDDVPFNIRVNNQNAGRIEHIGKNTTLGYTAGNSFTTAVENTAIGYEALKRNTVGLNNIAVGYRAGYLDSLGSNRLYIGEGNYNNAIIYGNMLDDSLRLNATVSIRDIAVSTSDSILVIDNGIVKYKITSDVTDVTDVTYSELLTKITDSTLKVGWLYRITDFAQAYNIFDGGTNTVIEEQIGNVEPLIVYALSTNKLERVAYSPNYPNDIIYYEPTGVNVTTDIGYSDGSGTLVADFKGVIEFRHDTKQNVSTWYDFRNIKFRRWAVDAVAYDGGTAYVAGDVCKDSDGKIYKCISDVIAGEGDPSTNTTNWILWNDITADAYISWTSDNSVFETGDINPTNLIFDTATYQDVYTFGDWYQHVNNVTIGKNDLVIVMDYGYNSALNNIVFKTIDDIYTCFSNEIGEISYNNTIGSYFRSNTIGSGFYSNTIGSDFYNNSIGSDFYNNSIGSGFNSNTIGSGFYYNTIGSGFYSNTIGSDFKSNTIGSGFYSNTIGSYFKSNTIGSGFYYNTIGSGFNYNTIGSGFYSNIIGSGFYSNTIGSDFNNNSIGSDFNNNSIGSGFNNNSIGSNFKSNSIGSDFNNNSIGSNFYSNTIGKNFNYNTIGSGFNVNTIGNDFNYNTIGNNSKVSAGINCQGNYIGDYNTQVTLGDNCTGISIGEKNDAITLGNTCTNLVFQNGCTFNTNTAATGLQNCLFESGTSITGVDFTLATHIKATYNKRVFTNASSVVRLSYFNADTLTVVNVND